MMRGGHFCWATVLPVWLLLQSPVLAAADSAVLKPIAPHAAPVGDDRRLTQLLLTDGIVRKTALEITKGARTDIDKARAIYEWVVDNTERNVVLEEKPGLNLKDEVVVAARQKLFGAWEMNWLAYNFAHDLRLPGSSGAKIPFLMYPQVENNSGRLDSLDPATFVYKLSSKEISAA